MTTEAPPPSLSQGVLAQGTCGAWCEGAGTRGQEGPHRVLRFPCLGSGHYPCPTSRSVGSPQAPWLREQFVLCFLIYPWVGKGTSGCWDSKEPLGSLRPAPLSVWEAFWPCHFKGTGSTLMVRVQKAMSTCKITVAQRTNLTLTPA